MVDPLRRVAFRCPDCGFVQQEPEHLISTFCRSCGSHYDVAGAGRGNSEPAAKPAPAQRPRDRRDVHCHRCDTIHEVVIRAQSTICPGCNAGIELCDIRVSSNVSRPIDTRGHLVIDRKGNLNCAQIYCGEADIDGELNGALVCDGTVRLTGQKALRCRIHAREVIVDRKARIEISFPVTASALDVAGHVAGQFEINGSVHVRKGGVVEGHLIASGITVDPGGALLAGTSIRPRQAGTRGAVTAQDSVPVVD